MARGLGFVKVDKKDGVEYERVNKQFMRTQLHLFGILNSENEPLPDYIPENILYRLACAACANANASLMGVQGVRLRFFFQILCGCAGETATDDARVKCAHKEKASLYADFGQGVGSVTFFGGFGGLFFLFWRLFRRMFSNNISKN